MILVDTSIWIEFFKNREPIHSQLSIELEKNNVLASEVVFGELLQGVKTAKESAIILAYWQNLPHPLNADYWILAGTLSHKNRWLSRGIGLIDASLVAIAQKHGAVIWSLDKKLNACLSKNQRYSI